jgi:hypothetical protein
MTPLTETTIPIQAEARRVFSPFKSSQGDLRLRPGLSGHKLIPNLAGTFRFIKINPK